MIDPTIIQKHTQELLDKMVSNAKVTVAQEDGMMHVNIKTDDDAPTVIGRHGETIRAIQKILEVIVFKETQERADILINVNDYREKQTERLQYIADQAAQKVKERQSATYLRGFSSYERRIMHEHVATTYPELSSYSVGEGRDRRLVVDLKGQESQSEPEQQEEELSIDIE
ncbi:MAG: KH domain-containing protein [bacterium]|nr:KH domain-containing protein [bacterium]